MAATTLDPAKKDTNATLSNGNLTVTAVPSAYSSVLSTNGLNYGRAYFEFTVNSTGGSGAISVGIGTATSNLTSVPGIDAQSTGYSAFGPNYRYNNDNTGSVTLGTTAGGTVFAVAVDFPHGNIWVKGASGIWNGVAGDDPATNTGGKGITYAVAQAGFYPLFEQVLYAMISVFGGSQGTANFGATGFTYTVPSGFSSWDTVFAAGSVAGTPNNAHRYWRLHVTDNSPGNSNVQFVELTMATTSGGANIASGGTSGASSVFSPFATFNASMGVDGNTATLWSSNSNVPASWWYDFGGTPRAVRELKMTARSDASWTNTAHIFDLQWRDDNTLWTTGTTFTAAAWTAGSQQTFLWGAAAPGGGAQAMAMVLA